jgi:hypothetical protein
VSNLFNAPVPARLGERSKTLLFHLDSTLGYINETPPLFHFGFGLSVGIDIKFPRPNAPFLPVMRTFIHHYPFRTCKKPLQRCLLLEELISHSYACLQFVGVILDRFQGGSEGLDVRGDWVDIEYIATAGVSFSTQQVTSLPLS